MSTFLEYDHVAVSSSAGTTPMCVVRELLISNRDGVHMQPAAKLVELARRFQSAIHFVADGQRHGTNSILDLLSADLRYGKRVQLIAEGADAEAAADAFQNFLFNLARQPSEPQQAAFWHWPNHLQSGNGIDHPLKRVA